jgi:hypothetical protein
MPVCVCDLAGGGCIIRSGICVVWQSMGVRLRGGACAKGGVSGLARIVANVAKPGFVSAADKGTGAANCFGMGGAY